LGKSNFRICVYEGLLVDSSYSFDIANIVGILCAQVSRMFSLDLSEGFALFSLTLHGNHLCFGKNNSFLSNLCFKCSKAFSESLQVVTLPYATNASGRYKHTTLTKLISHANLSQSRLIDGHSDNSFLHFWLNTILWNRFLATNFFQSQLATSIVKFFDSVEAVARVTHHATCLADIT